MRRESLKEYPRIRHLPKMLRIQKMVLKKEKEPLLVKEKEFPLKNNLTTFHRRIPTFVGNIKNNLTTFNQRIPTFAGNPSNRCRLPSWNG